MKPFAPLMNQTSLFNHTHVNLETLSSQSLLTKGRITILRSQPSDAKHFRQRNLQCQKSLLRKPLATTIYCQAYPSQVLPDSLKNTANWTDLLGKTGHIATDTTPDLGSKAKEMYDSFMPQIQMWYQSSPDLQDMIVPVFGTLLGTLVAWFAIPVSFFEFYQYISWNPLLAFLGVTSKIEVPYENSMWSALEEPVKYLIVFMAFSQIGSIVVPSISAYLPQLWRGAVVLSLVWFLRRWKDNSFSIVLANEAILGLDKNKLSFIDKLSSLGLNLVAVLGLAESFDIGVQSILTFSGIGGVATAYGAKDILANVTSGLSLQFSKPFSVGDSIKAGSIEGEVTEIGLISTSLINPEELPVVVPNSVFSSEMIVNKSRAQWHPSHIKVPIKIEDIESLALITEEIKSDLKSNPKVFKGRDPPCCHLSRLEGSSGDLTISCNLVAMKKDELLAAEQDILIRAVKIIKQYGAEA